MLELILRDRSIDKKNSCWIKIILKKMFNTDEIYVKPVVACDTTHKDLI